VRIRTSALMEGWDEDSDLWVKYKERTREMVSFLLAQVEPHGSMTAGWSVIQDANHILVSVKDNPDSSVYLTRVEGRVRAHPDQVSEIVTTLKYDPLTINLDVKKRANEINISHLCSRSPFMMFSDRDFSLLRVAEKDPSSGQWVCGATSVEVDFIPEQKGFVRAELRDSGWVIQPFGTEGDESFCTFVLCLDIKGWVPSWAVNLFRVRDVFASFTRLRALAEASAKKKQKEKKAEEEENEDKGEKEEMGEEHG